MKIKGLYCILPEFQTLQEYINFTKKLCKFNPNIIQLRIKNKPDRFIFQVAVNLKKILSKYKIPLIIDDRVDIALVVDADGVHLGQDDIPPSKVKEISSKLKIKNFIIGYSTHSLKQAEDGLKLPVNYISIGPVFHTSNKPEYKVVGVEIVRKVKVMAEKFKKPVVAIGGINEKNILLLKEAKPDAVAVINAIKDINPKVINLLKEFFVW